MNPRYANDRISMVWSNENKLNLWQKTELAVIEARVNLLKIDKEIYEKISDCLLKTPIDLEWWLEREKEVKHDLNAFLDERLRFLPQDLQPYFHDGMTSYDTEEPVFLAMITESIDIFRNYVDMLSEQIGTMARRHRYTIMDARTHGQEAQLQSFGKRCLTWLQSLNVAMDYFLKDSIFQLRESKLSGAIGNYGGLDHEIEKEALSILGFEPFYGATQIMPREFYLPLAQAICTVVLTLDKIATDIRLGARSGIPLYQEPFSKMQKGSTAMAHKKNTILTEQIEGMARMAKGFLSMITDNVKTWEERAIEQSCVERVAWPDLFHVAIHSLKVMIRVLEGLQVYPDNMMQEIINSGGCYASQEAKEFLRHQGAHRGLSTEDAYRIVQLAAFNAFEPEQWQKELRERPHGSFKEADEEFFVTIGREKRKAHSIQTIILKCELRVSPQLAATQEDIDRWHTILNSIFFDRPDIHEAWHILFKPSYLLRGEAILYKEILGDE